MRGGKMKEGIGWVLHNVLNSPSVEAIDLRIKNVRLADKLFVELEIEFVDINNNKITKIRRKQIAEFDIKEVPE